MMYESKTKNNFNTPVLWTKLFDRIFFLLKTILINEDKDCLIKAKIIS